MQIGDMFYEMDWTSLRTDIIKILPIVMSRSTKPIEMRSGYVIVLSAQSFTSVSCFFARHVYSLILRIVLIYRLNELQILNTSYTAFNVLQKSSS